MKTTLGGGAVAADEDKAAKRNRAMVTGILCCLIIQRCLLSSCWNVSGGDNIANRSSLRLGGPRLIGVQLRILLGPVAVQAEERNRDYCMYHAISDQRNLSLLSPQSCS